MPIDERVDLPGGRVLHVRPIRAGEVDRLVGLYASLSDEDLYHRFFGGYRPPRRVIERWAEITGEGGCLLVATVDDGQGSRLVADAGYAVLPDGSGELAITVAPGYRGWLGPFLLDCLVRAARAAGIPNLQADILTENRQMTMMMRRRGYVALDHPDFTLTRVMIGTEGRVPSWPGRHDRPRVLVEVPGARWGAEAAAQAAGWQVVTCPGPGDERCPAVDGAACPLAGGADVIVFGLRGDDPRSGTVLATHARRHPTARVVLEGPVQSPETEVAMVARLLAATPSRSPQR